MRSCVKLKINLINKTMTDKEIGKIAFDKFGLQECDEEYTYFILGYKEAQAKQLRIGGVGSSLPDLAECNQASLDYATKKDNPDFFLIKQTFKEGINWALNYVTKKN